MSSGGGDGGSILTKYVDSVKQANPRAPIAPTSSGQVVAGPSAGDQFQPGPAPAWSGQSMRMWEAPADAVESPFSFTFTPPSMQQSQMNPGQLYAEQRSKFDPTYSPPAMAGISNIPTRKQSL